MFVAVYGLWLLIIALSFIERTRVYDSVQLCINTYTLIPSHKILIKYIIHTYIQIIPYPEICKALQGHPVA
jgi:hypothetical protein